MKYTKIALMLIIFSLIACINNTKKEKIVFRVSNLSEPSSLDPQLSTDLYGSNIITNLFLGLAVKDSQTGKYKPGLAKSWNISDDGIVYTFNLREDVVWSDGIAITAEEIKKSYLRILNKKTAAMYANLLKSTIKNAQEYFDETVPESELGIKAIDSKTLEITLTSPKPYFPDMLTNTAYIPVPMHIVEKYGENWTNPENMVVSGAYKLKERSINDKIVIEKNDKYYNANNVEIDEVIFYPTEGSVAYNMYINGEIDFLQGAEKNNLEEIKIRDDYYSGLKNGMAYIAFNTTKKPLDNLKVRQAISLAIDRETLTKVVLKGSSDPTRNLTPKFDDYSYGKNLILFDPENAKKLLAEAGYPDGKGFPTLKYKISGGMPTTAEFLQEQFKKILNINLEIENEEWTTFLGSRRTGNYQMSSVGWIGDYFDPLTFLDSLFTTENHFFGAYKYSNKEYDALIKKSNFELDPIKRQDILRQAEEIIVEKDFPMTPLYIPKSHYLFRNDKWTGWVPNIAESYLYEDIKTKK
ncbi:peptide ABC transporter substrate-binding protein [Borreliella californiensis]|uniref:Oligopeptide transport system substrate-binding protein n=1 Tax=Borreliella californiensis TaxID=373543 RepID=A0A7W9ZMK9_9SPIR|nr:peptide ABC transporter substrate-binding protein [Borreliella californiensis]MBB6213044.1 oligopeptide transport system substrate-binding protein [Borreliella californiensis]WKC91622.1 peptide ABC transporter substrate-binding protein [Borreliella californiensis]WNY70378.1 peptide ABC transporter substrate-binding protein [Borreliella californiensis]